MDWSPRTLLNEFARWFFGNWGLNLDRRRALNILCRRFGFFADFVERGLSLLQERTAEADRVFRRGECFVEIAALGK